MNINKTYVNYIISQDQKTINAFFGILDIGEFSANVKC